MAVSGCSWVSGQARPWCRSIRVGGCNWEGEGAGGKWGNRRWRLGVEGRSVHRGSGRVHACCIL